MISITDERDTRVADFLDDKLQTLADLESLDDLLLNVRNQQSLLKQQLEDAHNDLAEAKKASVNHGNALKARVKQFNRDQARIDTDFMVVTQSETSDEAVRRFESTMEKLDKFNVAKGYITLVHDVDALSQDCISQLGTSDSDALSAYQRLRKLLAELEPLQEAADGAAPHLIHHIRSKADSLQQELEKAFSAQLEAVLKKFSWPNFESGIPGDLQDSFAAAFGKLLELQRPDLEACEKLNDGSHIVEPLVLLPFKVLVKPLELGFRYHFEGDRPTNRLERPEFFLSHVTERILSKYIDFIDIDVQPILIQKFRGTDIDLNYAYIDASSAFITALLPMVRNKVSTILPRIMQQPALLSHLIHELTKFDEQLRTDWQYDGGSRGKVWGGLANEVLSKDHTFAQWLKAEKDFALARYHEIVESPESFNLDFDSFGPGKTKPSKAAIRLNDLLEATTDNYRGLVSFSLKLRFLIDIQISIFDLFHERLAEGLGAYNSRISTISRVSREDQTKLLGLDGLERLCRIFGSADYLSRAMRDWNDDVFFLELWSDLQHRASQSNAHSTIAGSLTVAQVAARTSSTISIDESDPAFEEGALFDETAASYDRIRAKTETAVAELLAHNATQSLAPYVSLNTWASLSNPSSGSISTTTAELDGLLSTLRVLLGYLARAVGTAALRRLALGMLRTVQNALMDQVLLRHSFAGAGAAQVAVDVAAIEVVVKKALDQGVLDTGLERIRLAVQLLGVPVKDDQDEGQGVSREIGLAEAGRRLFEGDGERAKELLVEMGLDRLSVGDARKILARRVELGS